MFSPELENLIQATLEDGMLEDYEKAALVKRAQAEGADLTELEIYINSILQKRKKEADKEKNAKLEQIAQKKKRLCANVQTAVNQFPLWQFLALNAVMNCLTKRRYLPFKYLLTKSRKFLLASKTFLNVSNI